MPIDPGTAILGSAGLNIASNLLSKDPKPDYTHLKQGIQWRVADAKAAGIHPLYAMGANISSPTVISGGNQTSDAISSAATGLVNYSKANINKQQMALQSAESLARTNLLKSQAAESDFALYSAKASHQAQLRNNLNASHDSGFLPTENVAPTKTQARPDSDAESHEARYGELGGAVQGIKNFMIDGLTGIKYYLKHKKKPASPRARRAQKQRQRTY